MRSGRNPEKSGKIAEIAKKSGNSGGLDLALS